MSGTYRAVVIGETGQGNYGHGIDLAFVGLPGVTVVAVADPDAAGRAEALRRTGAGSGYADYREMLERERPDVVAVGPRQPHRREEMLLAAVRSGARAVYTEKPFARSLAEADRVLAAADERGVKIAVAHQNRAFAAPRLARRLLSEGKIGRLRAVRAYGKQDRRGGGQDLTVLGTHMLDLMRFFLGDAAWCHARVVQGGRDATAADVHPGEEQVGPIVGDDIVAAYGFADGVTGSYESAQAADLGAGNYFRLELCGTGGILCVWSTPAGAVGFYPRPFALPDRPEEWQTLTPEPLPLAGRSEGLPAGPPGGLPHPQAPPAGPPGDLPHPQAPPAGPPGASTMHAANQVLAADLLAAAAGGGRPLSSGHDARAALEMIMAVYEAHIRGGRVALPLTERSHPLERWTAEAGR